MELPPRSTMTFTTSDGQRLHGLRQYLRWALLESDVDLLEIWTALTALLWGLWLANPGTSLFFTFPSFRFMAFVAPEWVWGGALAVAGLLGLAGRAWHNASLRHKSALAQSGLWVCVFLAMALENWRWFSTVIYPALAAAALWVSYRASDERGEDDASGNTAPEGTIPR